MSWLRPHQASPFELIGSNHVEAAVGPELAQAALARQQLPVGLAADWVRNQRLDGGAGPLYFGDVGQPQAMPIRPYVGDSLDATNLGREMAGDSLPSRRADGEPGV